MVNYHPLLKFVPADNSFTEGVGCNQVLSMLSSSMCSHSVTVDGKVVTVHIMDTAWKVRLIFIILFSDYHFGIFKLFLHAFNLSMLK
jgi:hypothetical protein